MMRQFFRLSSGICRLTSCVMLPTPGCALVSPPCFPERNSACQAGTFSAAVPVATITRTTKHNQPVAAGVSTIERTGAVILHAFLAEGTGQQHPGSTTI